MSDTLTYGQDVQIATGPGNSPGDALMRQPRVAVIGAGLSGIGLGIRLKWAGFDEFTIFEKASEIGGTWRDHWYPGLSCDIPSRYYCYTFAPNPSWSRSYSPAPEILSYIQRVARKHDIERYCRFNTEVTRAEWDGRQWCLWSGDSDLGTFDFVVTAVGYLHHPSLPEIPGLGEFAGKVVHTARWDSAATWAGKRVGVIGNGSSGTQVVGEIAEDTAELVHFVRTPQWIVPMERKPYRTAWKLAQRFVPGLARRTFAWYEQNQDAFGDIFTEPGPHRDAFQQGARDYLQAAVADPELRDKLTPDYPPGCRRIVVSAEYYPAIQLPQSKVVRESIDRVEPEGIRTADGVLHELDLIIVATGYDTMAFIRHIDIRGEDGRTVGEAWRGGLRTYHSVALDGFPNFFMIGGPHSPFGHFSFFVSGDYQGRYATRWIRAWARGEFESAAPSTGAVDQFTAELRKKAGETVWGSGCTSWYLDEAGVPSAYPWPAPVFREAMSRRDTADFDIRR